MTSESSAGMAVPTDADEVREYYTLVKGAFEKLAPYYDFVVWPISRLRERVVGFTNARSGSRILDVATGTGKQAFAFGKRGHEVTAVDLSEAMLAVARKNNRWPNVRLEIRDATDLGFEDSAFDVSCISFALHDMPARIREGVLREMARVTKPGGTILIVDYALPRNKLGQGLVHGLVRLYEGPYYTSFVRGDLGRLLEGAGIAVTNEQRVLMGAARMVKGTRAAREPHLAG